MSQVYHSVNPVFFSGTHNLEDAVNKQLNDKERVAAALENTAVLKVLRGNDMYEGFY